jgi:hypothetical protein
MTQTGTRLEHAEIRLDQAQGVLDTMGRVLDAAEKAQAAAERAASAVRSVNVVLVASLVAFGAVAYILRHHH